MDKISIKENTQYYMFVSYWKTFRCWDYLLLVFEYTSSLSVTKQSLNITLSESDNGYQNDGNLSHWLRTIT